ncbi:MAG: DUF4150 domain-containing protein [Betaproteobacteria bacterium]|nr:DUF4150 domain-containing protein [Betaproteobacteria bacterium]MBI3937451.1 DUF4150 domain-containing protein [Betaproteobacteria bacterium]
MFANTQMGGMNLGFPDVCITPMAPAPIPVPYPNISTDMMGVPAAYNVLWGGTPAHNLGTEVVLSNGDNPGVMLGVASGTVMGPTRPLTGAFTVLVGGMPATRMTSMNLQNSTDCPGVSLVPSQVKVLLLAP